MAILYLTNLVVMVPRSGDNQRTGPPRELRVEQQERQSAEMIAVDRYSSSHSKTHRAAMGFSSHSTGCVKPAKECRDESRTINGSAPAAKIKNPPA